MSVLFFLTDITTFRNFPLKFHLLPKIWALSENLNSNLFFQKFYPGYFIFFHYSFPNKHSSHKKLIVLWIILSNLESVTVTIQISETELYRVRHKVCLFVCFKMA